MAFYLGEGEWLFYGLLIAAVVLLGLGSVGIGVGGSFNAWDAFLNVTGAVAVLELLSLVVTLLFSLLASLGPLLVALLGAYVFSKIYKSGSADWLKELLTTPNVLVFLLFLLLFL